MTRDGIYRHFGVRTIINAKGPATRLSGGPMRPAVTDAMAEASRHCVDMAELQAAASRIIARATGAEAGYVASGASACLLLATAACMAGLDPGKMARLPDTRGMKSEVVMVRSQRNFYDHAIRAAGATIVEVGLPDRYAGAGVRDAEAWEIEDAIGERTAAIFYVADCQAQPPLGAVTRLARKHRLPVIVDAAAQLPPQSNLKRFIAEGAALVAFSGGKAIGGPQASGILCGRRDLVMSAALQHLDLDVYEDMWTPPAALIDKRKLKGIPQHGIGRGCKAGKEEIVGLLTALEFFIAEGDAGRHGRWLALLADIAKGLAGLDATVTITGGEDIAAVPLLEIGLRRGTDATRVMLALQKGKPSLHLDPAGRARSALIVNPVCLAADDVPPLLRALVGTLRKDLKEAIRARSFRAREDLMDEKLFEKGLEMRRATLGKDYVDQNLAAAGDFTRPFQEAMTAWCWGFGWGDDAIDAKTRSMINLAMLGALGKMHEWEIHCRGAITNGVSVTEIRAIIHVVGIYCGVPQALECFRTARKVLGEHGLL